MPHRSGFSGVRFPVPCLPLPASSCNVPIRPRYRWASADRLSTVRTLFGYFVVCRLAYNAEMRYRTNSEVGLLGWYSSTRMMTSQTGSGSKPDPVPAVAAALQVGVAHASWSRPLGTLLSSHPPSCLPLHASLLELCFREIISDGGHKVKSIASDCSKVFYTKLTVEGPTHQG